MTQADLDRIEAAISTGVRRVRLNGREEEYHSVGQLMDARDAIKRELAADLAAAGGAVRPRSFRSRTNKGL